MGDEGLIQKARAHQASIAIRVELEAAAASSDEFALTEDKEEEIAKFFDSESSSFFKITSVYTCIQLILSVYHK